MPDCGSELFISDLHLSPREPATTERFLGFLAGPARTAARLTILGDLFDYWAGDDDLADPFNAAIAAALHALAGHGVSIDLMVGNRDFLIGADFASAAGVRLLADPCVRAIGSIKTLLTHGDTLCTDDADYQRFRAAVRTLAWRSEFLARPLAARKQYIEALRLRSETEKRIKPAAIMDVNADAVVTALREHGAEALIHGHTHREGQHAHIVAGSPCQRWVLGDWQPGRASALRCTADGWGFTD